jgi:hypothetical protein
MDGYVSMNFDIAYSVMTARASVDNRERVKGLHAPSR